MLVPALGFVVFVGRTEVGVVLAAVGFGEVDFVRQVVAVVCRLVWFVVGCFPTVWGLALVVVAAGVVVVAPKERYRDVDFAIQAAVVVCRLAPPSLVSFPVVVGLVVC